MEPEPSISHIAQMENTEGSMEDLQDDQDGDVQDVQDESILEIEPMTVNGKQVKHVKLVTNTNVEGLVVSHCYVSCRQSSVNKNE